MRAKMQPRSGFLLKTYVILCISINYMLKVMVPDQKFNNSFAVFGGNFIQCNGLSKLVSVFLGPLVWIIMQ